MDYAQNYRWSVVPFTKPLVSSILEEFRSLYRWQNTRDDENRTALDIGFGDGSVTTEIIKPFLPVSTQLDGADKSEDMIRFAKQYYDGQEYKFFFWDVEGNMTHRILQNTYNHVFSFFCFHYISKMRQALRNIYDILKPNGNIFLMFIPNIPFHAAIKAVSHNPKWSLYMQDVDAVCPLQFTDEESPHKVFAELMSECGFKNVITKVDVKKVLFDTWDKLEGQARYVDVFRKRMPLELQEEYFAELLEALKQIDGFWTEKCNDNGDFVGVFESCEVLIGYGEKGSR